jgi:hypothetical protein
MDRPTEPLSESRRREIFAALVAAQDRGVGVADSRAETAARYGLTSEALAGIEREGMEAEWPPL